MPPPFTTQAQRVLLEARERARAADPPALSTGHLLGALLSVGPSLAQHALAATDVDLDELGSELARQTAPEPPWEGDPLEGATELSGPARAVLQLARAEAASFDHDFMGCEHLLLAVVAEPDGVAGRELRRRGVEHAVLRRMIAAAFAAHQQARGQ